MAKAEKIQETVVRRDKVDRYQLTLTEGEADFLLAILATIGGTNNSPRKYQRRISEALRKATDQDFMSTDAYHLLTGTLNFADYKSGATDTAAWRNRGLELLLHPEYATP